VKERKKERRKKEKKGCLRPSAVSASIEPDPAGGEIKGVSTFLFCAASTLGPRNWVNGGDNSATL